MAEDFKDFDAAVAEVEDRYAKFQYGGETFEADLNVSAGALLTWMESGGSAESIPGLLRVFFDQDEYDRLVAIDEPWSKMEQVMLWLVGELSVKN
jgi:hypothetical protein